MADIERALTFIESIRIGVEWNSTIPPRAKTALTSDLNILEDMLKDES
jgi:hypothetical protein